MPDVRGGTVAREAEELIRSARITEVSLRSAAAEVSQQVAAHGRPDAMESVVGANSLARAAAEISQLIKEIQAVESAAPSSGCPSK